VKECDGLDEREPYKKVLKIFVITIRHCIGGVTSFLGCPSTVQYSTI